MTTERHIKLGRLSAIISFLLGTIIFGLYYFTSADIFIWVGFLFIILTGLFNLGLISKIISPAIKDSNDRQKLVKTAIFMALNIPIAIFYIWGSFILLNTMRITFTNPTQTALTDIQIIGCETEYIDKLEAGQSKTVWVKIVGDCSIDMIYLASGQRKEEMVVGYATGLMGQKITHIIGKEVDGNFTQH
jgi:hypothetical protein